MMLNIILIIVNIACLIAFIFFIRVTNKNTNIQLQKIKILKDMNNKLKELEKKGELDENRFM